MAPATLRAVILTALSVEFEAVREFLPDSQIVRHPSGNIYERGTFQGNDRIWEVGIAEVGMGDAGAALETERAISFFDPQVILFVGIAGGIKDVEIGDVVTSTKIYCYESGKAKETFEPRPELGLSSYALIQQARAEKRSRSQEWLNRLPAMPEPRPKVEVGAIAAGEKVIASTKSSVYQFLRTQYGDALAVEMEGYGFLKAAHANERRAAAIVVRGISDLIDHKDEGQGQESEAVRQAEASRHAGAFAFQLLANFDPYISVTGPQPVSWNVAPQVWDELFNCFQEEDLPIIGSLFEEQLTPLQRYPYPELSQLDTLQTLRGVVQTIDNLDIAVAWVGRIIDSFESLPADEPIRSVSLALRAWYKDHRPAEPEPATIKKSLGYLLVALDPVDDEDQVTFTAELHGPDGEIVKTDLVSPGTKCSIGDVCELLSEVIPLAGEVQAVEVFLPWQHLNQPVHQWKIRASDRTRGRRNQRELWRVPRNTLVRSLDRLKDKKWTVEWLNGLQKRWEKLQALETLVLDHVCCADSLTDALFNGALDEKLVFKFLTLPHDQDDLIDLLYEVIGSKVPIWLWSYEEPADANQFFSQIDELLAPENLRDSTSLAQVIRDQRQQLPNLGLLFDCPTRLPSVFDGLGSLRQPAA